MNDTTATVRAARRPILLGAAAWLGLSCVCGQAAFSRADVEADWLRQVDAWGPQVMLAQGDAAGAVDGVKNGQYGFHTGHEPNPWWQVDLGALTNITRLVVFNRLDYAPGLHNADGLRILVSDEGKQWRLIHDNAGQHFGGIRGAAPLELKFAPDELRTRFVRLQLTSAAPIFFHLDEVEIYGPGDPARNLAWRRPADQSSTSQWSTNKLRRAPDDPIPHDAIGHFIERGQWLARDLSHAGVDVTVFERELNEAAWRLAELGREEAGGTNAPARRELYLQVRSAVRRLAFANPLVRFDELLLVKRFTQQTYPDICLNHMPWVSKPGGDLCVLRRPFAADHSSQSVRAILNGSLGAGHVHGLDLWWDGSRIVFGYARKATNQPPAGWLERTNSYHLRRTVEPTHLFEIGVDGGNLRQLTRGEWSDLDPTYLPNGDIVFVSERCGTSLQCNEYDKDETSCNLYVMKPDGSQIRRLSVNKDGDYLPHTLDDGTVAYTRWEYHERSWAYIQSIWTLRPDGTQADAIFKQHFTNPWALEDTRSIPGSRQLVSIAAGHHTLAVGPLVVVDPSVGINDPKGISILTPQVKPPEGGMDGLPVPSGGVRDRDGFYSTPWALSEKYFLVAYTYGTEPAPPVGYGLYLVDVFGNKELVYRDPDISCFTPIPLRSRSRPPVLPDLTVSTAQYATCVVSTVSYGCDGIAPERIRFIRIAEPIGWPYDNQLGGQRYGEDHRYSGPGAERKNLLSWTPIRILGDVPVERDGSAKFIVPQDTAVYFQILDENRMELRRMRSFISFQPGEQRACTGCHESRTVAPVPAPHSTSLAMPRDAVTPLPPPWGDRPVSFLRDVQPVLDRHCVSCHSGLKAAGGIDLFGGPTAHDPKVADYGFNRAYETILEKALVSMSAVRKQDTRITPPLAYGAINSKLITCLADRNHAGPVALSPEDRLRLTMWIDANAPYHDRFVNKRTPNVAYNLAADRLLQTNLTALHARRCAACHKTEAVTRLDWVDLNDPARSLFLMAPLPKDRGGSGKCAQPTYLDPSDADYRAAYELLSAAVQRTWEKPPRDLRSLGRSVSARTER